MWRVETLGGAEVLPVRQAVLWPDKPMDFSRLTDDSEGFHFGLRDTGRVVSVASLFLDDGRARLRKFATLQDWRSKGLGRLLLAHCLAFARRAGCHAFWCDARVDAMAFYQRHGLRADGPEFMREGHRFVRMSCDLDVS